MSLQLYLLEHVIRGACQCGQCIDAGDKPQENQPKGHTADVIFFKVANKDADAETLRRLVKEHKGEFADVDLFDGEEHGFIELGAWIGDQGLALMLMGVGSLLGLWKLLTPRTVLRGLGDEELVMNMAQAGLVTITADTKGENGRQ